MLSYYFSFFFFFSFKFIVFTQSNIPSVLSDSTTKATIPPVLKSGYLINWENGKPRKLLNKDFFNFVNGINKTTQLKMEITILPDGTVQKCISLQQTDGILVDEVTKKILRLRFSPLKGTHKRSKQTCIITLNTTSK